MKARDFRNLKIGIIGGCQVTGLTSVARHLLPGATVEAWHVGVTPPVDDEELLAMLPRFDMLISQLSDWDTHVSLRISRLREAQFPIVYLPVMVFTGFHPDMTYVRGKHGLIPGLETDYHSVIIAAAYALGLTEVRAAALFNTLVFAQLGYFDVFPAAKEALFAAYDHEGYDLRIPFERWVQHVGQFMHTMNHPHIVVLAELCRLALAQGGYVDKEAPLPADPDDVLGDSLVWPTYPALARRIGIDGSTVFLRGRHSVATGESRALPLEGYISASYRKYSAIDRESLCVDGIAIACDRLRTLVV